MNIVRFVNLIPFVSDSLIFPGICDVWATCDEFLYILSGDEEEHSVLLVNFFLGIGKKAWLLIGKCEISAVVCYTLLALQGSYLEDSGT
jgi:coiled-coil and C2 domain-containing protein 2A